MAPGPLYYSTYSANPNRSLIVLNLQVDFLILPLMIPRYKHHTVQSLAGSACFYSKLIIRSLSFAEFSELGWQIQFNCCKDAEISFSFSCECVSLKLNIKQSVYTTCH
jgi:hypothetical protein